jgi:hypothetical protein
MQQLLPSSAYRATCSSTSRSDVGNRATNRYEWVCDVDLALRIAETLGIDVEPLVAQAFNRRAVVEAIKRAVMEGDA